MTKTPSTTTITKASKSTKFNNDIMTLDCFGKLIFWFIINSNTADEGFAVEALFQHLDKAPCQIFAHLCLNENRMGLFVAFDEVAQEIYKSKIRKTKHNISANSMFNLLSTLPYQNHIISIETMKNTWYFIYDEGQ